MASIEQYLEKIMTAIYGEEVRGSIHDAIQAINDETVEAEQRLQQNIETEESARQKADQTLQSNIDAEIGNRTSADSTLEQKITTEQTARETGDDSLRTAIDKEKQDREKGDGDLSSQIEAEKTAREKADDALRAAIGTGGGGSGSSGTIIRELTIPASGWVLEDDMYKIEAKVTGALSNWMPLVSIHPDSLSIAEKAGLSPVVESVDGGIQFRASRQPDGEMTATAALLVPMEA